MGTTGDFSDEGTRNFGPFTIGAIISNANISSTRGAAAVAFGLAPNPARGSVRLLLPVAAPAAQTAELLDVLGRSVRRFPVPARVQEMSLSVTDLPRGLYLVRVGGASQRLVLE